MCYDKGARDSEYIEPSLCMRSWFRVLDGDEREGEKEGEKSDDKECNEDREMRGWGKAWIVLERGRKHLPAINIVTKQRNANKCV